MMNLDWKNNYSIHIFEIDAEHKVFLKTIKKINNAFENNLDTEIKNRLLSELYKYADFHFTSEENVMLFCDYPEYETHRKQHIDLMQKLADIINFTDIEKINTVQLIEFLVSWFKEHTTSSDLRFGTYLHETNKDYALTDFNW